MNPCIAAPALASNSRVNAICPAMSVLWMRLPRIPPITFLALACITCETSGRLNCIAGESPKSTPVKIANPTLKHSTGRLIAIAASWGNENSGSNPTITATVRYASRTPNAAPLIDNTSDSVSNCRMMRERPAPTAARTANSCSRAVPRANNRIETLPHPIASNKATEPSNSPSVGPISSMNWSLNPCTFTRKPSCGKCFGVSLANCSNSD